MSATVSIEDVEAELLAIGELIYAARGGLQARAPSQDELRASALDAIKSKICPHRDRIEHACSQLAAESAIILIDIVIMTSLSLLAPPTKIAQVIILTGIRNFCNKPESIVNSKHMGDLNEGDNKGGAK